MKIKILGLVVFMSCIISACGADDASEQVITENPDFRNVKWGMTVDEVRKCEKSEPVKTPEESGKAVLKYSDQTVAGLTCSLEYYFYNADHLLNGAEYRINTDNMTDKEINDNFLKLYDQITQKYGNAEDIKFAVQDTNDNFYFEPSDNIPDDLEFRSAVYRADWNTGDTKIVLDIPFSGASPQWIELSYSVTLPEKIDENI